MITGFEDRRDAGRLLAERLDGYRHQPDCMILGLPRGGVVVAAEVSRKLGLPMDVCVVRKLGVPFQPELAMGAIGPGGVVVLHDDVIAGLGIDRSEVEHEIALESRELARREALYRGGRPPLSLSGKTVILVDDGIATGATVEAAISAIRRYQPARLVVAAAVAAPSSVADLKRIADDVVCVLTPPYLSSIGEWYMDFEQVSDAEVEALLAINPVEREEENESQRASNQKRSHRR